MPCRNSMYYLFSCSLVMATMIIMRSLLSWPAIYSSVHMY